MKNFLRVILIISCCSLLTACALFDRTAPQISLKQEDTIQIEVNTDFDFDKYIIASDNRIEPNEITLETTLDSSILGEQEITVSATDTKDNTSTITFTIEVVDTTPPEITLNGSQEVTIAHSSTYTDEGATVSDNFDDDCSFQTIGSVDTNKLGTYQVKYISTDSSLNQSTIIRSIHVVDLTGPEINVGENEVFEIRLGQILPEDFGLAYDAIDGYVETTISGTLNYLVPGEYCLTYTAKDSSGNSTSINRIICIDPWVIDSKSGVRMTINSFELTNEGLFGMENTLVAMDIFYENTTDKQVYFSPIFLFHNENMNDHIFNMNIIPGYILAELGPKKSAYELIEVTYDGIPADFFASTQIEIEVSSRKRFVSLENKYDFCLQDLIDYSFVDEYIIK